MHRRRVSRRVGHQTDKVQIEDDELVEVTPKAIRLRKRVLNALERIGIRKGEAGAAR